MLAATAQATPDPRIAETDWLVNWKLPKKPARRPACSIMKAVAPPNSPPAENPWISRATSMPTGASNPICR